MLIMAVVCCCSSLSDNMVYVSGNEFYSQREPHRIYAVNTEELNMSVVVTDDQHVLRVTPSPDRKLLAFNSYRDVSIMKIATPEGRIIREIANARIDFSWSPDSKEIVFCGESASDGKPTGNVFALDVHSGDVRTFPFKGNYVFWSKKSGRIMCEGEKEVISWDPSTQKAEPSSYHSTDISASEDFCLAEDGKTWSLYNLKASPVAKFEGRISCGVSYAPVWMNEGSFFTLVSRDPERLILCNAEKMKVYALQCSLLYATDAYIVCLDAGRVIRQEIDTLESVSLDEVFSQER